MKETLEKAKKIEGVVELHHFIQTIIQELPEPDRKVVEECWTNTQTSIKL